MEELLKLYDNLSRVGFGSLIFLVLVGSYFEIWFWGKYVKQLIKEHEEALEKERRETEFWRSVTLRVTGIAEATTALRAAAKQ